MSRTVHKVNVAVRSYFTVYDATDAAVTGLVDGDFIKLLAKDGANSNLTVTITEIGSGRYCAEFTPDATGDYYLLIRHATYNPRGWQEQFEVSTDGIPAVADIQSGLATGAEIATLQALVDDLESRLTAERAAALDYLDRPLSELPTGDEAADALLDRAAAIDSYTPRQILRVIAAAIVGKGRGDADAPYRAIDDSKPRVTATVDSDGNRTAMIIDAT